MDRNIFVKFKIFILFILSTNFIDASSQSQLLDLNLSLENLNNKYSKTAPSTIFKRTQTEAFLSIPALKQAVKICYEGGKGICQQIWGAGFKNVFTKDPEVKKIVDKVLDLEKEYKDTHFVFYHAHKFIFRILADFNTQMCILEKNCSKDYPFIVLRNFGGKDKKIKIHGKDYSYFNLPDLNTWMDEVEKNAKAKKYPYFWSNFDFNPQIKAFLLSVNPSLYNNINVNLEHTFLYFLASITPLPLNMEELIKELVNNYIKDPTKVAKFVNELIQLTKPSLTGGPTLFGHQTGELIQIFIPHELVDNLVYLSKAHGIFWNEYIKNSNTTKIYDKTRNRYIAIYPILEIYINNPNKFAIPYNIYTAVGSPTTDPLLDVFQNRILLKGEYFSTGELAKKHDIRIYRYSTFDKSRETAYLKALEDICKRIYAEKDV